MVPFDGADKTLHVIAVKETKQNYITDLKMFFSKTNHFTEIF